MNEIISIDHELLASIKANLNVALAAAVKAVHNSANQAKLTLTVDLFEEDQFDDWNGSNSVLGSVKAKINLTTKEKVYDEAIELFDLSVIDTVNGPILKSTIEQTSFNDFTVEIVEREAEDD